MGGGVMGRAVMVHESAGSFATARRGGLTNEEIRQIEAHRARERPTPWQALSKRYAVSEISLRQLLDGLNSIAPEKAETPETPLDAEFRRLWDQGVVTDAICTELGMCRSTAWKTRVRLGLEPRQQRVEIAA